MLVARCDKCNEVESVMQSVQVAHGKTDKGPERYGTAHVCSKCWPEFQKAMDAMTGNFFHWENMGAKPDIVAARPGVIPIRRPN